MNIKNFMNIERSLSASHTENNKDLIKILSGKLKRLGREKHYFNTELQHYWPAEFFGLHKSSLFNNCNEHQRIKILTECSNHLLREAYFIEKSGLAYCAKMVLLADTTEVAQTYSLIGSDEATHLQWITPYVTQEYRTQPKGEFLIYLTELIQQGDSSCLMYLLQVILEGWGLHHYKDLSQHCQNTHLKKLLADIVRDEALHHKTGTILFKPEKLSSAQRNFIQDSLASFLEMVRVGPLAVVSHVEFVLGGLNNAEKILLIEQLSGPKTAAIKLKILKQLMSIPGCEKFIDHLNAKKMFTPYSSAQCV